MQLIPETPSHHHLLHPLSHTETLLQSLTAAKIEAARTIWVYWSRRFKHSTLWRLIDNARRLKITKEDTNGMG